MTKRIPPAKALKATDRPVGRVIKAKSKDDDEMRVWALDLPNPKIEDYTRKYLELADMALSPKPARPKKVTDKPRQV